MKVLLLYPEFPDTFWGFKHALKFIRKKASIPPLGLLTVAAMLPRPWEKRLADLNVRKLAEKDLRWADLVFISSMIVQRESVKALIGRCRSAGKTIVAGGPLFSSEHEQFPCVDHFVLNEAEPTLPELLRDLEQGCARRVYASTEFPDIRRTPGAVVGAGGSAPLRLDEHPVLARLPVRLRVLRRDGEVRPPPPHRRRRRRSSPN